MPLSDRAILVVEDAETAAFEFNEFDALPTTDVNFLIGGSGAGELIGELADFLPEIDSGNRAGYAVDVGLGSQRWELSITLSAGEDPAFFGPVDAGFNPIGGSTLAAAHNADPVTRALVLQDTVVQTEIDSLQATGSGTLYYGAHSDATFAASGGRLSPVQIAPESVEIRQVADEPSKVELTLTLLRTEEAPTNGGIVPEL